jgi:Icc-related predicted phosphoesterase
VRVTVISDLHGALEHVDAVARDTDVLLVLGDLVDAAGEGSREGKAPGPRPDDVVRAEYEPVFSALPGGTLLTFGDVDVPDLLCASMPDTMRFVDGNSVRIGSMTFGLVGGGLGRELGLPGEVRESDFDAKLEALGPVDVICTHAPPRIPWYVYDVGAKRFESGSVGLIAYVRRHRPRYALFGHVHQPLVSHGNIGMTEMVNVGHFRVTHRGFTVDLPD